MSPTLLSSASGSPALGASKPLFCKESCNKDNFHLANKILYDLIIYGEWKQDGGEYLTKRGKEKSLYKHKWLWYQLFGLPPMVPEDYQKLHNLQLPWQIVLGREGRLLAVVQSQSIEIRSAHDEFSTVLSICIISRDSSPHWRKACWSPDQSVLALAYSTGAIDCFDVMGTLLFTIEKNKSQDSEPNLDWNVLVAEMIFLEIKDNSSPWSYELLVLNFNGTLHSYYISLSEGFEKKHEFSFDKYCPFGVTSMAYLASHNLLVVGGPLHPAYRSKDVTGADRMGLSLWRVISDYPFYKFVSTLQQDLERVQKTSYFERFPFAKFYLSKNENSVYKMSISPSGKLLAVVHTSGDLSLWHLPSLRPQRIWSLEEQINFDQINPNIKTKAGQKGGTLEYPFYINSLAWWSDEELIISRNNGALTVTAISDLDNRLGNSPEWLLPTPQVTQSKEGKFLALECEAKVYIKNWLNFQEEKEEEKNTSMGEGESTMLLRQSLLTRLTEILKIAIYYLTDNERFQPLQHKPRILHRKYRLLCLKSTTPQELFMRMLNTHNYQDALALAHTYNLDCDLVYQRQWRNHPVTLETIFDYLSKITKRIWVLHECLERVPESYESTRSLLLFGLSAASLNALVALGTDQEVGRTLEADSFVPETLEEMKAIPLAKKLWHELSSQDFDLFNEVNLTSLNPEQKQLIHTRQRLILYLDRLATYEAILGPAIFQKFNAHFFEKFRAQSWLEACLHFARQGAKKTHAILQMFANQPLLAQTHHLVVLSNFPEFEAPSSYASLLPRLLMDYSVDYSILDPLKSTPKINDWCETIDVSDPSFPSSTKDTSDDFYTDNPHFKEFRGDPSPDLYSKWYKHRAAEIYDRSCLLEHSLELIRIGKEFNIMGLGEISNHLASLECLLYDCLLEDSPSTFKAYVELPALEKVKLFMAKSTKSNFVKHLRNWVLPFVEREGLPNVLNDYLKHIAQDDLEPCYLVFNESRLNASDPVIPKIEDVIELALECIYVSERNDQLEVVFNILECLPEREQTETISSDKMEDLHNRIDLLEKQLMVAEIFSQYNVLFTMSELEKCHTDPAAVRSMLTKLTQIFNHKDPPPSELEWGSLRFQILTMQEELFSCLSIDECLKIVVEGLLSSGRDTEINLARSLIQRHKDEPVSLPLSNEDDDIRMSLVNHKLPYHLAKDVILSSSRQYFDSAFKLSDPCMTLARNCLDILEDDDPQIKEEKDLISALTLLHELSVDILPLQMRLFPNKLDLIKQALVGKFKPAKLLSKLQKLAQLLHLCGSDKRQREAQVLALVAEASFNCEDYAGCYQICQQIVAKGHEGGWKVCYFLGMCSQYSNLKARHDCLCFASAYCTPDLLGDVLKMQAQLEILMICEHLKLFLSEEMIKDLEEEMKLEPLSMDPGLQVKEKGLTVTARSLLSSLSSSSLWKKAIQWPGVMNSSKDDGNTLSRDSNSKISKQGFPTFLCPANDNLSIHHSQIDASYSCYSLPNLDDSIEFGIYLYRILVLKDVIEETPFCRVTSEVVNTLLQRLLPEDLTLAFSLLLSLKNVQEAGHLLAKLPAESLVVRQLSVYFYSFILYTYLFPCKSDANNESLPYKLPPIVLFKKVWSRLHEDPKPLLSDQAIVCQQLLQEAVENLQAQANSHFLQSQGVDLERFASDAEYKKDTILGMALSEETYQNALLLASHYGVDTWEVSMARLEFFFTDSSLPFEVLKEKVEALGNVLASRPPDLLATLQTRVYETIQERDIQKMELYYKLLTLCCTANSTPDLPTVQKTLKFIQKVSPLAPDFDVKNFLSNQENVEGLISPYLKKDNLNSWKKALDSFPKKEKESTTDPALIDLFWAKKIFLNAALPLKPSEWLKIFDSNKYILESLPLDLLKKFVEETLFTEYSIDHMGLETRLELLQKVTRLCKKKTNSARNEKEIGAVQAVLSRFQQLNQHLTNLMSETLLPFTGDPQLYPIYRQLDLTQALPEMLNKLYLQCVMDNLPLDVIQTLLSVSTTCSDAGEIYLNALQRLESDLRANPSALQDIAHKLEAILKRIEDHSEEIMLFPGMVLDVFDSLCTDPDVSPEIKLKVLELLIKIPDLSDDELSKLKFLWIQNLLRVSWPKLPIPKMEHLGTSEGKMEFFRTLLSESQDPHHFSSLLQLILMWSKEETALVEEMCLMLAETSLIHQPNLTVHYIIRKTLSLYTTKTLKTLYHLLAEKADAKSVLKMALMTKDHDLSLAALHHAANIELDASHGHDVELLDDLIECNLIPQIVGQPLFQQVVRLALSLGDESKIATLARQLHERGFLAEAGSLLALSSQSHPSLVNFSSVIDALQRWL